MRIHIIGIAGFMTAPLAACLISQGHRVTGSDQEKIYPPVSTILKKANIKINSQVDLTKVDLIIVGSSYKAFSRTQAEYLFVKKNKLNHISATKYLAKFVAKKNSILIAGSHGKTTTASLVTWILIQANLSPSYMFGGQSLNKINSLGTGNSPWSVLEADESINGLDTKAKFLYYPVKYLLLTSAFWEHKDSYKTQTDNLTAFANLLKRVPSNGFLLYKSHQPEIGQILQVSHSPKYSYGSSTDSDFYISKISHSSKSTKLTISAQHRKFNVTTKLLGQFNFENVLAAFAFTYLLGIPPQKIIKAISKYRGISRRLEYKGSINGIHFYDDFAQAPNRIKPIIDALKERHPGLCIKVFFEPHASFLQNKNTITQLYSVFTDAQEIVLSRIPQKPDIPKDDRVSFKDYQGTLGDKIHYIPLYSDIINYYKDTLRPNDVFVHLSSGGLDGLKALRQIINYHKKCHVTS